MAHPFRHYTLPLLILLLATALRLYHLDFRALWWDEGLSLFFARLDFRANAQMAVKLADTNPPVYRMLLGVWLNTVGWSAFTARLFSVVPGVILVAIVYRLARDLKFSREVSLLAMALCAASPMLIYYSQEAKGYSLVAMGATASVLLWLRLLPYPHTPTHKYGGVGVWVLWGLSVWLAIGSHYIAAFLIALENVWTVMFAFRSGDCTVPRFARAVLREKSPQQKHEADLRRLKKRPSRAPLESAEERILRISLPRIYSPERSWLIHWAIQIAVQLTVAALLLPFVLLTYGGTSAAVRGATGEFRGLNGPVEFFGQHAIELTQGPAASGVWAGAVVVAILFLAVLGFAVRVVPNPSTALRENSARNLDGDIERFLAAKNATRNDISGGILASWIIVPTALGFALNSYHQFFFPRFVLYAVPALMLLAAQGISRIALCASRSLPRRPQFWNSKLGVWSLGFGILILWAPTLAKHYPAPTDPAEDWRPVADAMRPLVREGDAAIFGWGWMPGYLDAYLPHVPRPDYSLGFFTTDSLNADMTAITSGRDRVWLLDYQIDHFDVRNLAGRWLRERSALVDDQWFGNAHVALFALEPTPTRSERRLTFEFANGLRLSAPEVQAALAPGDAVVVSLTWEATRPIANRATIFLHGLAADGTLAFGRDSEPNNGFSVVTDWKVGEPHAELRGAIIPPDTIAGRYSLSVGLYDTATGQVIEGAPAVIGTVVVR